MILHPHHDGSDRYVSTMFPQLGDTIRVRVRVPSGLGVERVFVRGIKDAEPAFHELTVVERSDHESWWEGPLEIHNPVTSYRFYLDGECGFSWLNGTGWHVGRDITDAGDFLITAHAAPPEWAADAVVYQVFPDRFGRSAAAAERPAPSWAIAAAWDDAVSEESGNFGAQFYGGDLDGITEHLDHIASLHVDVIYVTPFFPGGSCHRYDASTFLEVDPLLGGGPALVRLVEAAHARGIRVIGDLTTNHTGNLHQWFQRAQADADSTEASYYFFRQHPNDYVGWLDVPTLPKLDWRSEALRAAVLEGPDSVVGRWLVEPYNLDGWRIDVANMTGRYRDVDEAHRVAETIRATMREVRPDSWLVAEHGHNAGPDLMGAGWHGTMNYSGFTRPVWTWLANHERGALRDGNFHGIPTEYGIPSLPGDRVVEVIREVSTGMPWRSLISGMNKLDSHDTPRFINVVGFDRDRYEVGLALLFTVPGAPMVFAGAETGQPGANGEYGRIPMPWGRADKWDERVLAMHQRFAEIRRGSVALRRGGWRWLEATPDAMTYERESADGERIIVHAARADHAAVTLPDWWFDGVEVLHGSAPRRDGDHWVLPVDGPAAHIWRVVAG